MLLLKHDEIPSLLHPSSHHTMLRSAILGHFKKLSKTFCIQMDTFQELEYEVAEHFSKIYPIKTIGPLFNYPKLLSPNRSSKEFHGDLLIADNCVIHWLDSKQPSSIVYISFGSLVMLKQEQVDEIVYVFLS